MKGLSQDNLKLHKILVVYNYNPINSLIINENQITSLNVIRETKLKQVLLKDLKEDHQKRL